MTYKNRIKTTTTSTGTGNLTTGAAAARCRDISAIAVNSNNVPLLIEDEAGADWEFSYCTILAGKVIQRDTVIDGSAFPAKTNFGAGTKTVFCDVPAENFDLFLTPTTVADLGTPLADYLNTTPAGAIAGTDALLGAQGSQAVGIGLNALATWAMTKYPTTRTAAVRITAAGTIPLDFTTHNARRIIVTAAGVTLTGPTSYASVGDDFECEVFNLSGGVVTFGSGISAIPSGTTLAVGGRAVLFSTAGSIYASLGSAAAPDTVAPTAVSAAVSNATPAVVEITMSEAMDSGNVPAPSAFPVTGHTPTAVSIVGNKINVTYTPVFTYGETPRTVAYAQPGAANARDLAQNLLANFSGLAITNNVAAVAGDTTAPSLASPTGTQTGATTASGSVSTNEANGTLYRYISTNATETVTTVTAANLTQAVTAAGVQNVTATGLAASTTYYWHFVHRDAAGNDSTVANSGSFTTAAASGGGTAPFTVTNRANFPLTRSAYNGLGDGNNFYTDISPTGAATAVAVTFYASTSGTIHPIDGTHDTGSPKGDSLAASAFGSSQPTLWTCNLPLRYSVPVQTPYYFWIKVVDSNGATWWFLRNTTIQYLDNIAQTYSTATETMVQA